MNLDSLIQHLTEIRSDLGPAAGSAEVHIFFDPDPGTSNPERYWFSEIDDVQSTWAGSREDPSDIRINLVEGSGV